MATVKNPLDLRLDFAIFIFGLYVPVLKHGVLLGTRGVVQYDFCYLLSVQYGLL